MRYCLRNIHIFVWIFFQKLLQKKYREDQYSDYLEKFTNLVQENGHFVGNKVSVNKPWC